MAIWRGDRESGYGGAVVRNASLPCRREKALGMPSPSMPRLTLTAFAGFSVFWLKESLSWNHAVGLSLIAAGAFFIFHARA